VANAEELASRFSVEVPSHYVANYNAAPSQLLPIITSDSPNGISTFYWGLAPALSKNKIVSERIINMRAESVLDKAVFRRALKTNRCLVPADGYYEWKRIGKKTTTPYRFVRKDRALFSFAGLWEEYEDVSGAAFHTFSIFTTPANDLVTPIHDRMPVILQKESEEVWLSKTADENALVDLLKPYPADVMDAYTVSPRVNSILNTGPSLIIPAPAQDQYGNLTLFG
jgi:putative SOS response-associated peptidase YedK